MLQPERQPPNLHPSQHSQPLPVMPIIATVTDVVGQHSRVIDTSALLVVTTISVSHVTSVMYTISPIHSCGLRSRAENLSISPLANPSLLLLHRRPRSHPPHLPIHTPHRNLLHTLAWVVTDQIPPKPKSPTHLSSTAQCR